MSLRVITIAVIVVGSVFFVTAEDEHNITDQKCGIKTRESNHPWLVGIQTTSEASLNTFISCAGVLVSQRHVLLNAHCPKSLSSHITQKTVILGVVDFGCTSQNDEQYCLNDGAMNVPIETIVTHPKATTKNQPSSDNSLYDIALITLRDPVPYTDVIRPICFPTTDIRNSPAEELKLSVSGIEWKRNFNMRDIKLMHIPAVDYIDSTDCRKDFITEIAEDQICANDASSLSSCLLSGSALTNKRGNTYELIGLVNYGARCNSTKPTQYTNLFHNLDWVLNEISNS